MSRIYVLGAAGEVPALQRQTSSYLLDTRRGPMLFDAGTGLGRLADPLFQELVARSPRAWVFVGAPTWGRLAGLPWLASHLAGREVVVAGPVGLRAALDRVLTPPLYPGGFSAFEAAFSSLAILELRPGRNRVLGESVRFLPPTAEAPAGAFRVREIVFATGSPARGDLAEFCHKASALIHDASVDAEDIHHHPERLLGGSLPSDAARLARDASVQDLILGHLAAHHDPGRLERLAFEAAAIFPRTTLASDMMCLKLSGVPEDSEEEVGPGSSDHGDPLDEAAPGSQVDYSDEPGTEEATSSSE